MRNEDRRFHVSRVTHPDDAATGERFAIWFSSQFGVWEYLGAPLTRAQAEQVAAQLAEQLGHTHPVRRGHRAGAGTAVA